MVRAANDHEVRDGLFKTTFIGKADTEEVSRQKGEVMAQKGKRYRRCQPLSTKRSFIRLKKGASF
jgi:hypothetical protein